MKNAIFRNKMTEGPLLSIITVNLNNLEGLKRTMASVFEQTWQGFEYLIIDGGSTDGSKEYIVSQSNRIDYWVSEPDKGIYNAMNKGIKVANGEYLLFLNSGDFLYNENALTYFTKILVSSPNKDIYYGKINVVDEKEWVKDYPKDLSFSYFVKDTLPHPASFIKKKCFKQLKYDESLKIVSDWKFFITGICKMNFSYQYFDEIITNFFLNGISSINSDLVKKERNSVLARDFPLFMVNYHNSKNIQHELKILKRRSKTEQFLLKIYRKVIK